MFFEILSRILTNYNRHTLLSLILPQFALCIEYSTYISPFQLEYFERVDCYRTAFFHMTSAAEAIISRAE